MYYTPVSEMACHYIECGCGVPNHLLQLVWCPGDSYCAQGSLAINYQLDRKKNFFQRLWSATLYIFGYDEDWGHWHSTSVEEEDVKKLIAYLERSLKK